MNIWIDIGMVTLVLLALPLLASELVRLGRLFDEMETEYINKQLRDAGEWDRIEVEERK